MKKNEEEKTEVGQDKSFTFVVKRTYIGHIEVYARDENEAWKRFEREGEENGYATEDYFEIESDDVLWIEE
jgi:hypothetical protein